MNIAKYKNQTYYFSECTDFGFELTTNKKYAGKRAGRPGPVLTFKLKESANIFSMKDKNDEAAFRKYCQAHEQKTLKYIEDFKKDCFCDGAYYRAIDKAREIIKALGYEGFFNNYIDYVAEQRAYNGGTNFSRTSSVEIYKAHILEPQTPTELCDIFDANEETYFVMTRYAEEKNNDDFNEDEFIEKMYKQTYAISREEIVAAIKCMTPAVARRLIHNLTAF